VGDFLVVLVRELVDREEPLVGIEGEMPGVVVGEVEGTVAVADDEQLHEAEEGFRVSVARIVLVFDDLLHSATGADAEGLQFDLDDRDAVDEEDDVVPMVAVVGVDAELVDDLVVVFAPVLDIDQGVIEGRAVVACEGIALAQGAGGDEDVGGDDLVEQTLEFGVAQLDAVEGLEFLPEVPFEPCAIADVGTQCVLEPFEFAKELGLDVLLTNLRWLGLGVGWVANVAGHGIAILTEASWEERLGISTQAEGSEYTKP